MLSQTVSFFEQFLKKEQKLFARQIDGIRYWHYIRFQCFDEIIFTKSWIKKSERRKQETLWHKFGIAFSLIKNSLLYTIGKDTAKTELLVLNSPNKFWQNNRYVEPYIDPWLRGVSFSFTCWEDHLLWRHKKHGRNPHLFYLDSLHLRSRFYSRFRLRNKRLIFDEAAHLVEFARQFSVELSPDKIASFITLTVSQQLSCRHIIRQQLRRKGVRLIVLLNHYDPLKMLITSVARELGIYVVELQHGNMGKYHIAYNFGHNHHLDTLPHEIFTFGKFWNHTTRISQNGVKLTAVGFPYFEERIATVTKPPDSDKTIILFLSQASIGHRMGEIAHALSERLDPDKYEIHYKLHPREYLDWRKTYPPKFIESRIKVVANADLYKLMNQADIHIGVYSTTVMESLAFNKKLILLESYGVHYFLDLIESGRAALAKNADEVLEEIEAPEPQNFEMDLTYYWEQNSIEKMTRRIEELLT